MPFPDPQTAPKAGSKAPPSFVVGDTVKSTQHFMGIKDQRCYNDVPKGTIGKVVSTRRILDKKNPERSRTLVSVDFEVELDAQFKTRHINWKQWYPKGWVLVRHQTTTEGIIHYNP